MTENFRLTTDTDREAFYRLYQYAFNNHDTPTRRTFFMDRYQHGWIYGLHDHDQLVSGLYSLPLAVNFYGVTYPMNGIGDVMSAPEYSGRGGAGKLITAALNEMVANKIPLSYLAPFSFSYYRKFGYEQVFNHTLQTIAADKLPRIQPHDFSGSITRYGNEGLALVNDFYAAQPANQRGGLIRSSWWLNYLTEKHAWSVAIYRNAADQIEGYLVYERQPEAFVIKEWATSTPTAYERLANFVTKHGTTFSTFSYEGPDEQAGFDLFADPYSINVTTTPYMMARIVLLHDFLAEYPFTHDLTTIRLAITDETLAINQGIWELSVNAGRVTMNRVKATLDSPSDLQLTIQQLTKALFGARSLTSAWQHGLIQGDLTAAHRLDASLVHQKPALIDYF